MKFRKVKGGYRRIGGTKLYTSKKQVRAAYATKHWQRAPRKQR